MTSQKVTAAASKNVSTGTDGPLTVPFLVGGFKNPLENAYKEVYKDWRARGHLGLRPASTQCDEDDITVYGTYYRGPRWDGPKSGANYTGPRWDNSKSATKGFRGVRRELSIGNRAANWGSGNPERVRLTPALFDFIEYAQSDPDAMPNENTNHLDAIDVATVAVRKGIEVLHDLTGVEGGYTSGTPLQGPIQTVKDDEAGGGLSRVLTPMELGHDTTTNAKANVRLEQAYWQAVERLGAFLRPPREQRRAVTIRHLMSLGFACYDAETFYGESYEMWLRGIIPHAVTLVEEVETRVQRFEKEHFEIR